jgi:hypothetical protein
MFQNTPGFAVARARFKEIFDKSWFHCKGLANSISVHHFADARARAR